MFFENPLIYSPRDNGAAAVERVKLLAQQYGYEVTYCPKEDYGGKIDLRISGAPFQISAYPKSVREQYILEQRGIQNLSAAPRFDDCQILDAIIQGVYRWYTYLCEFNE